MPKRSGTVLHGYAHAMVWGPTNEEAKMAMEKRAVVNTDKEKTAAQKVEKSLPQDKPNQQPKPPTKKDK